MDAESSAAGLVIDAADLHASSESSEATTAKKAAAAAEPTFDALTATQMKARRTRRPPARGAPPQRLRLSVCVCRRHPPIFCARACSRAGVLAGVRVWREQAACPQPVRFGHRAVSRGGRSQNTHVAPLHRARRSRAKSTCQATDIRL